MIKFRIHPKIWEGERCKFWKVLSKCQNFLDFFYIFWDILNKMKDNLCQKCVKGRHLSLQGKFETIAPGFPGKMVVFSSFGLTFPPVPP